MQKLSNGFARVETGVVQFDQDWPGVFIRGDNAAYVALMLEQVLNGSQDPIARAIVQGHLDLLKSSNINKDIK